MLPRPTDPNNVYAALSQLVNELEGRIGSLRRLAFGSGTLTWSGLSLASNGLSVTHGLATTPKTVLLTSGPRSGVTLNPTCAVIARDGTTFTIVAHTVDAQVPVNGSTVSVDWIALA